MADNLVKFVYAANATAEQIAAFDANTIYFVGSSGAGAGGKLYKGPRLYDSGAIQNAADLAALETYVGEIPEGATATDVIHYIQEAATAAENAAKGYTDTLNSSLAAVAKSGAAADVSVADSDSYFTATTVEGVLAELYGDIQTGGEGSVVTMESASGSGDTLTVYSLYQGVTASDDAAAKLAKKIGDINIPKDYLVRSATIEVVKTANQPYAGAEVGDKYIDFVINTKDGAGTGTAQHIYIALDDLVAVMSGGTTSEITVAIDSHNKITATVNEISGDKVIYAEGTGGAADITVNDKLDALEDAIGDGIDALDGSATIATVSSGVVTLKGGISEVNGVINNDSSSDITLAKVATTGAAIDVSYGASSNVKAALDTIGTIPSTATATTVVGYVDEKVAGTVAGLDADVDAAAVPASGYDTYAVGVVSGVTEVDGVITGVDTAYVDAAGSAMAVKADVIGTSSDTADADTINGAKAYADGAVSTAVTALDADKDATGTALYSGTFVMSGVTQVDGLITSIDSVEVENAGAAAAAEAAAKAYTDAALTWGNLS